MMFGGFTQSGESSEARVLHLPTMVSHLHLSYMQSRLKSEGDIAV